MKHPMQRKAVMKTPFLTSAALVALSLCLSSCHFNSAAFTREKASYQASVKFEDIKPGHLIYMDAQKGYVELPCYKSGPAPELLSPISEQKNQKEVYRLTDEKVMVSVSRDYALYLTGKRSAAPREGLVISRPTEDSSVIKERCAMYPARRTPEVLRYDFKQKSFMAPLWHTMAAMQMCSVDLVGSLYASMLYPVYWVMPFKGGSGSGVADLIKEYVLAPGQDEPEHEPEHEAAAQEPSHGYPPSGYGYPSADATPRSVPIIIREEED